MTPYRVGNGRNGQEMKNIIKALKHCVDKDCEGGCPYDLNGCYGKLADDTITLLTHQKEEIERLQKLLDEKCDIIKGQEAEIERLKQANKTHRELLNENIKYLKK